MNFKLTTLQYLGEASNKVSLNIPKKIINKLNLAIAISKKPARTKQLKELKGILVGKYPSANALKNSVKGIDKKAKKLTEDEMLNESIDGFIRGINRALLTAMIGASALGAAGHGPLKDAATMVKGYENKSAIVRDIGTAVSPEKRAAAYKNATLNAEISLTENQLKSIESNVDQMIKLIIKEDYDVKDEKQLKQLEEYFKKYNIEFVKEGSLGAGVGGRHTGSDDSIKIVKNKDAAWTKAAIVHELTHRAQYKELKAKIPLTAGAFMNSGGRDISYFDKPEEIGAYHKEFKYIISKIKSAKTQKEKQMYMKLITQTNSNSKDKLRVNILKNYPETDSVVKFFKG